MRYTSEKLRVALSVVIILPMSIQAAITERLDASSKRFDVDSSVVISTIETRENQHTVVSLKGQ